MWLYETPSTSRLHLQDYGNVVANHVNMHHCDTLRKIAINLAEFCDTYTALNQQLVSIKESEDLQHQTHENLQLYI